MVVAPQRVRWVSAEAPSRSEIHPGCLNYAASEPQRSAKRRWVSLRSFRIRLTLIRPFSTPSFFCMWTNVLNWPRLVAWFPRTVPYVHRGCFKPWSISVWTLESYAKTSIRFKSHSWEPVLDRSLRMIPFPRESSTSRRVDENAFHNAIDPSIPLAF